MAQEHRSAMNNSAKFSSSQLNFNLNNAHQLIPREQTFVLDRKLLTIHSEDRDLVQWPNANQFEIQLPTTYTSVSTLQLVECNITTTNYTFSKEYQNTKFSFKIFPSAYTIGSGSTVDDAIYYYLNNGETVEDGDGGQSNTFYSEISEGYYTPQQLVNELEFQLNRTVTEFIIAADRSDDNPNPTSNITYSHFHVYYDGVTQRLWIANDRDGFRLLFGTEQDYTGYIKKCDQPVVWGQSSDWGLPFFLGFSRKNYDAVEEPTKEIHFGSNRPSLWLRAPQHLFYVQAPFILDIYGETAIYMEIEKMNSCDEIEPYRSATNRGRGNDFNGTVNSYFAKIPLNSNATGTGFAASNSYMYLYNMAQFNPVIDKLRRLKFTMRYHDGRLVDFRDTNFNFTISLGQIHDEIARNYILRVPNKF